jgi:hypothetical protein
VTGYLSPSRSGCIPGEVYTYNCTPGRCLGTIHF